MKTKMKRMTYEVWAVAGFKIPILRFVSILLHVRIYSCHCGLFELCCVGALLDRLNH
jgi:hypothetical protein